MPLEIDLSTTDKRAHEFYDYPEDDDALKRRLVRVASRVVTNFEEGRNVMEATEELYAVTRELRERGYGVSIDVAESVVTIED